MTIASGQLDLLIGSIHIEDDLNFSIKSHGASGMLNPENVVFYHPLDDNIEHTLTDTWEGSGTFVAGVIGSGISAVTPSAMFFGVPSGAFLLGDRTGAAAATKLETDKIIITASSFDSPTWTQRAVVVSISGFDMTFGAEVLINTGNLRVEVVALTPSSVVFISQPDAGGKARVGSISGLEITTGDEFGFNSSTSFDVHAMQIDSTRFGVAYEDTANSNKGTMRIGEVSGTTITFGTTFVYSDEITTRSKIEMISASGFILTYRSVASGIHSVVGALSGTTITSLGTPVQVPTSGDNLLLGNPFESRVIDSTRFIVSAPFDTGGGVFAWVGSMVIGSVSGTTITFGSDVNFTDIFNISNVAPSTISMLSGGKGVIGWKKRGAPNNDNPFTVIFNTSGTTITNTTTPSLLESFTSESIDLTELDDTRIIAIASKVGDPPLNVYVGELFESISLISSNANYPKPIGNKNLATFFWSKNPTKNNAQVRIGRGYNITFASGSIALGGNTATWNSSGIQSLMAILNDDSEHSLATYFEHQGGTSWKLFTSLDGQSFVDRDVQDAGSQILLTSSTDTEIFLFDPDDEDQWLDESALWAGEPEQFNQFNNLELFKLDGLARTLNIPLSQFASAAFPVNASGDLVMPKTFDVVNAPDTLFIEGFRFSDSGLSLFINGTTADVVFEKIIDIFSITNDFKPMIIGLFTPSTSGVTIEVFDLIGGNNTQLTINDALCVAIGDTGRFGWSTNNLPILNRSSGQYIFRMTDSVGTTFVGEFFLDSPESRLV